MASNPVRRKRVLRVLGRILLAVCLFGRPAVARAANNCPWINEATASGLLSGEAVGEVSGAPAGQPTVCTFTRTTGGVRRALRVTVEVVSDSHAHLTAIAQSCGANATALKAIGNEAFVCAPDAPNAGMGERVVGRVRDQVFTITIGSSRKNDPILTRDVLKSRIYTAAEQVAGNLF
jgi:hypothetical protein